MYHCPWPTGLPKVTWPRGVPLKGVFQSTTGSCAIPALVGPFHRKWRYEASSVVTEGHVTPKGVPLGGVHACATGSCTICALVGLFHRKYPLGCSLGRPRPISSMATGTSPFTGFLPLSGQFISAFNNDFHLRCFRICCVVLQVAYHVRVAFLLYV